MKLEAYEWATSSAQGRILHLRKVGSNKPWCGKSNYVLRAVGSFSGEELNRVGALPMCHECKEFFDS